MKRIAAIALVLVATVAVAALGTGAKDSSKGQPKFTVELDNAFGLIKGGDFKVAGVRAGKIEDLRVDRKTKRALVDFTITEKGFGSLRTDAECLVAPQSLVGEYFVDCDPGKADAKLKPGSTIPVEKTSSTVPPDLVNNIMRLPQRERLRLIIGELGAAVAGNGEELNAAIRRAVPALRETNRVLAILARQNQTLADLTRDADRVVGALADKRTEVSRWVREAGNTARISATRDREIAEGFERLPTFLAELEPTMRELGRTADRQAPALRNLAASAPQLSELFDRLPRFADATRPALRALGRASVTGREAVRPARATVAGLERYSRGVPELGKNLAIILEHLDDRKNSAEKDPRSPGGEGYTGLEALLQYTYDQTMAINIHDGEVHILKVFPFEGPCAPYGDKQAVAELGDQCGRTLGPNSLGFNSLDPNAPPNWDGSDRGPESSDPSVRRRAVRPEGDPARQRYAPKDDDGADPGGRGGTGSDGAGNAARGGGDAGARGGVFDVPKLDDVLPGGAPKPAPPKTDLPDLRSAASGDQRSEEQLLDFLLGS